MATMPMQQIQQAADEAQAVPSHRFKASSFIDKLGGKLQFLVALVLFIALQPAHAQNFLLTSSPRVGSIPVYVIAADVNGDGKIDLVSANLNDNTLTVLTNNGMGVFTTADIIQVGNCPFAVVAADLAGRKAVDLVCGNGCDSTLTIFTNNGSGAFGSNVSYTVGNGPQSLLAADVNGDGKVDLVCANWDDFTVTILTNNGNGTFTMSSTNAVGRFPSCVVAADLNGDGRVDLVTANWGAATLTVLTNGGYGVFGYNATYPAGSFPECLAVADLNGDGMPDLVCGSDDDTLVVLTNNGTGGFVLGYSIPIGADFWPQSVITADLKGNGKLDLICVNFNDFAIPGTLTIMTNSGTGEFTNALMFSVGEGPYSVVAADLNGDGKLDLVTANHMDNALSILINVPMLQIAATTNDVVVSWVSSWTNWCLFENSYLSTEDWSLIDKGIVDDGTNKSVTITSPKGSAFFRLSYP
jgi:hypothetical protein